MVFAIEEHVCLNRTDVSSSDSISSSSNHSGSDVIVATNEPYSPTNVENGDKSETSEEGSVEVMDKGMRFSSMDFSTPNSNSTVSKGIKSVAKSLSSRSHSSKSSSQTSQKNTLTSCSARSFLVNSVFTFSYADFSQVTGEKSNGRKYMFWIILSINRWTTGYDFTAKCFYLVIIQRSFMG